MAVMPGEHFPDGSDDMDTRLRDIWARAAEQDAARLPDGHFAEYQGRIPFSTLDRTAPLQLADAPRTVSTIIGTMPWGQPHAPRQIITQAKNPSSQFNRALLACMDAPQTPEADAVFGVLSAFIPPEGRAVLANPRLWTEQMQLLNRACECVYQKRSFELRAYGATTVSPAMEAFTAAMLQHIAEAGATIYDGPEPTTPLDLIRVVDGIELMLERTSELGRSLTRSKKALPLQRGIPAGLYDLMDEADHQAVTEWQSDTFYIAIEDRMQGTWERSQETWNWETVDQLLSGYPDIASDGARVRIIDALEDIADADLPIPHTPDLTAEGLAAMLHDDIYRNRPPLVMPPTVILHNSAGVLADVRFGDITLPREQAPTATIAVLHALAERLPAQETTVVLERMQQAITRRAVPTSLNDWLLTLALLRKHPHEHISQLVDTFIARDDFPHKAFQHIITSERPGHIFLLANGKIRVDTRIANGHILASSSAASTTPPAATPSGKSSSTAPYSSPNKGALSVPGVAPSRRRQRKAQGKAMPAPVASSPEKPPLPTIIYTDEQLAELGAKLSPADMATVRQTIADNQQHGRHPLEPLRGRSSTGALRYKLRVNGVSSGIRTVLEHIGGNQFAIQRIDYRGAVYKNLPS